MAGLLYKDFVAVKGKKLILIFSVLTVLYVVLRMAFPGTVENEFFMAENVKGDRVNLLDTFFAQGELMIIWMGGLYMNLTCSQLPGLDEKNRIRGYLFSLPLKKSTYVAAKYVFMGIMAYVIFSLFLIWHVICTAFMGEGFNVDIIDTFSTFALPFMCAMLLLAALELPLYLLLGRAKAKIIMMGLMLILAFFVFGYIFFGDLSVFDRVDIAVIIKWLEDHSFEMVLFSILSPVITLAFYYGSYRLTCYFYERREDIHDEE